MLSAIYVAHSAYRGVCADAFHRVLCLRFGEAPQRERLGNSLRSGNSSHEVGAGKDKHILLVVDKAGWHTGKEVEVPEGIHVEFLSSGSPELQSAKRLWPLTHEVIANWLFKEISEMEQALVERCVELLDEVETIRGLANYHWWPQAALRPSTLQPDSVRARSRSSTTTSPAFSVGAKKSST